MFELKIVRNETSPGYDTQRRITDFEAAQAFLADYFRPLDREHLVVLCLDAHKAPIGWNLVAIGSLDEVAAAQREVFKAAVLANAHSIVLAHNHPTGKSLPSEGDLKFTQAALRAGEILNIPVLDHLVFGPDGCTSVRRYVADGANGAMATVLGARPGEDPMDAILRLLARRGAKVIEV